MKVERYDVQSVTFDELKVGECFESEICGKISIFVKTNEYGITNAVELQNGSLVHVVEEQKCKPLNAKVVIE